MEEDPEHLGGADAADDFKLPDYEETEEEEAYMEAGLAPPPGRSGKSTDAMAAAAAADFADKQMLTSKVRGGCGSGGGGRLQEAPATILCIQGEGESGTREHFNHYPCSDGELGRV